MNMAASMWLVLVFSFVSCVISQAPGDGDPLCVDEVINGEENPFFALRPTYPDNVRHLMDSRDYVVLLRAKDEMAYIPWQQVDNDNNNSNTVVTDIRTIHYVALFMAVLLLPLLYIMLPVDATWRSIMQWYSYSMWL